MYPNSLIWKTFRQMYWDKFTHIYWDEINLSDLLRLRIRSKVDCWCSERVFFLTFWVLWSLKNVQTLHRNKYTVSGGSLSYNFLCNYNILFTWTFYSVASLNITIAASMNFIVKWAQLFKMGLMVWGVGWSGGLIWSIDFVTVWKGEDRSRCNEIQILHAIFARSNE